MCDAPKLKRDYAAEYSRRSRHSKLANWYKTSDKRNGRENDLSSKDVKLLICQPCFWCGKDGENIGLDRKDNSIGHTKTNIIPSCYKCNMILSDLPFEAKLVLREGMRKLCESGLIDDWEPPPFRREKDELT